MTNSEANKLEALRRSVSELERRLDAVGRIAVSLSTVTEVGQLVREALNTSLTLAGAEAGSILLYDPEKQTLVFEYVVGEKADELTGMEIGRDEGIAGQVFQTSKTCVSEDVSEESVHLRELGERIGYVTTNMITVPLRSPEAEPLGVMQVLNKRGGQFDDYDTKLVEILGAEIALAIEQAHLYREAKVAEVARLLGDISHDIKNMLTPVIFGVDAMKSMMADLCSRLEKTEGEAVHSSTIGGYPPGFDAEIVTLMEEAARRIQDRVKEIADCVKGVTSPLAIAPCSANDIVERICSVLRPIAQPDSISLVTELAENLPPVEADSGRLYSMLYNLMDNAMTAIRRTERPGQVIVITAAELCGEFPEGSFVSVEVVDTGCGMSPETQARLFTPAMRSTTTLGTGLGTKIIKDVVDAHGGEICVNSTLEVGTRFRIKLPLPRSQSKT